MGRAHPDVDVTRAQAGPRAAAVYCRLSREDARSRRSESAAIERQRHDCLELCSARGWAVAEVYVDDGVSAYDPRKVRPAYRRMLADVAAGARDAVVVYDLDRLHRQPRELEEFFAVCEAAGLTAMASVSGDVDLSTHDGRFHARILGAVAAKSSDDTSRRVKRAKRSAALAGRPAGGRGYGYRPGEVTDSAEADVIRTMATRLLAGDSLAAVAAALNRASTPTATGLIGAWRAESVRRVVTAPRVAGLRIHHGEVVADGTWEPIISRAEHDRLRELLAAPAPVTGRLLSGLLACGRCQSLLRVGVANAGHPVYRCVRRPGACGRLTVSAGAVEDAVSQEVLAADVEQLPADPASAGRRWRRARPAWRRELIRQVLGRIVVLPAARRGWRFDPGRLVYPDTDRQPT